MVAGAVPADKMIPKFFRDGNVTFNSRLSLACLGSMRRSRFMDVAPAHLHLPLMLALWTGQRQGDLLQLPWSAYDGQFIRLRQGKGGRPVRIPVGAPLKAMLDTTRRRSPLVLVNSDGLVWSPGGFRCSWRKACAAAGVDGVTFHDIRGSAITRLAEAGCTVPEIAAITGHSLGDVEAILDAHYLGRTTVLAMSGMAKLEDSVKPAVKPSNASS